jgi:hypothetical protein
MTTPTNLPTGFDGTYKDFLKTKVARDGSVRVEYQSVAVADNATAGTTYGLIPFNKGARISYGSRIGVTDLDTASNVTLNVGYAYKTGSTGTDDPDAFASALSGQASALLSFDEKAGLSFVAADDGWVSVTLAAGPVTTAGTIEGQILIAYDGLDSAN